MNVPRLRFKEFSGEWEVKKVGVICDFIVPGRNKPTEFEGNIPWITTPDIEQNGIVLYSKKNLNITREEAKNIGSKIVPKNSIIISCVGELGLVAVSGTDLIINQQLHAFIPKENIYFRFLLYALTIQKPYMEKIATKTAVPYMNKDNCNSIPVIMPSLPEQTKIANFLTAVDEKIAKLTQKGDLLARYKKGVMQQIFSQQLRFKDDDGREFPEWDVMSLGEVAKFRRGSFPQPYGLAKWYDDINGMPFIQVFDVDDNFRLKNKTKRKISKEAQLQSVFVEKGSILITIQGSIGRIAITQYDAYVDRTLLLFESFKIKINKYYFAYVLFLLFEIEKEKAPGGIIKTITKEVLTDFEVFICDYAEQTKIANFLTALDDKITHNQTQLKGMEYSAVRIDCEADMLANLKRQMEIHNQITPLTPSEFVRILNHLNTGSVFERAKVLRDKFALKRDNNETVWLTFLNCDEWCMNEFQVTHQVTMEGHRKNRYDVTLLINGLPLVQIELKRRGAELKVAFNQVNRYQHDSYDAGAGLFQYVQLFIISNGVNTKYFSNNLKQSFKQTFFWTDKENNRLSDLYDFTAEFLKPCHIAKMVTHYTVINETSKCLMILRPYQFYATEALVDRVKNSMDNAYIWHTTGSGKTLTSFKASQIIMRMPKVHKVLFVVDRKDLDFQTANEFNAFSKGSVDSTTNTHKLVAQLTDDSTKLIVTTIQKLNNAIMKERYVGKIAHLQDKKFVFIFDECHRSQFGDTHQNIKKFFNNAQMFGFTGTPIFADNAVGTVGNQQTTASLFSECLHKYVIVDAIRDENVLRFAVEYVGKYQRKDSANELDIEVEAIDTKELLESPYRLEKITDYILTHHRQKTKAPDFTAMFCVSSVATLIKYYELFKLKQTDVVRPLKIATIFSYAANEEDPEANGLISGLIPEESPDLPTGTKINQSSRDKLDDFIADYNALFGTQYNTKDSQTFYNYYQDIAKRVRRGEIDLLLVVNMFLTGFDSPRLNTLYVDKNLKFHGLVQAFSRTNRILNEKKSQGNIVCFRNLKAATDEAIALFSNKDAKESVLVAPYEEYVKEFNNAVAELQAIAPTVQSVDDLPSEKEQLAFVIRFRELLRVKNILTTFADFDEADLSLPAQTFEDYKSKYLDVHDKVKKDQGKEKTSILEDVDFELSLIHRDEINVAYILNLLMTLGKMAPEDRAKRQKEIVDIVAGEMQLRSKKLLIQAFIDENLPNIKPTDNVIAAFESFWADNKQKAFSALCEEEQIVPEQLEKLLNDYTFANRLPREQEIVSSLSFKPKILQRKSIIERVGDKIKVFIDTFIEGMGGSV